MERPNIRFECWNDVPGVDVFDLDDRNSMKVMVPEYPGIYVWRRSLTHLLDPDSPKEISRKISDLIVRPSAVIPGRTIASSVRFRGIEIGVGELTEEKKHTLKQWTGSGDHAQHLARSIATLQEFFAPLYVGSAENLCARVLNHVKGETDFSFYLQDELDMGFDECVLSVFPLETTWSQKSQKYVEFLEFAAQRILGPLGVKRAG